MITSSFRRSWVCALACLMFCCVPLTSYGQFGGNRLSVALDNTAHSFDSLPPSFRVDTSTFTKNGSSVRSAFIGNSAITVLSTEIQGGRTISFDWKVSSEAIFDELLFLVLDESFNEVGIDDRISGNRNWARKSYRIPPGTHYLTWAYAKDFSISIGQDAGWVDNVVIPGVRPVEPEGPNIASLMSPIIGLLLSEDKPPKEPFLPTALVPAQSPLMYRGPTIALESESGDYIGQGLDYAYSPLNADITVSADTTNNRVVISLTGDSDPDATGTENWNWTMEVGVGALVAGEYAGATRYPFNADNQNGLDFSGTGRGCNQLEGSFTLNEITFDAGGSVERLFADFEQYCDGSTSAIRGSIQYDTSLPEYPDEPLPEPDILDFFPVTPELVTRGPVVRLESDAGDYIGAGKNYNYDSENATFSITRNNDDGIDISINGDASPDEAGVENWTWSMSNGSTALLPGVYENASRYPFNGANQNGLSFSGSGRGCNTLTGEFTIYEVAYGAGGVATKLIADFVQGCSGSSNKLRGSIRYDESLPDNEDPDTPAPDGELFPAIPELTNNSPVVRLSSESGDFIGAAKNFYYLPENSNISVSYNQSRNSIEVSIDGHSDRTDLRNEDWRWTMDAIGTSITPGTYLNATRSPFNPVTSNGLNFSGSGRGCNTLTGEFTIYELELSLDNQVEKLVADFEQLCGGSTGKLRGSIRFDNSLETYVLPAMEQPTGELVPTVSALAGNGTVMTISGDAGDYIIGDNIYQLTSADTDFTYAVNPSGRKGLRISIDTQDDSFSWDLDMFRGTLDADPDKNRNLTPGVYQYALRASFSRPNHGLDLGGNGRGCNTSTGTFRIFEISFDQFDALESLVADFEQYCGQTNAASRGSIRYQK